MNYGRGGMNYGRGGGGGYEYVWVGGIILRGGGMNYGGGGYEVWRGGGV